MQAGANFASSPARILIDILDPLIVAKKVATTDDFRYIRIEDIENDLRDGRRGVSGTGANGKRRHK
jgi:yabG peptidase U57